MSGAVAALLICVAGGIGAALRLILDGLIKARIRVQLSSRHHGDQRHADPSCSDSSPVLQ